MAFIPKRASFDIAFLNAELKRAGMPPIATDRWWNALSARLQAAQVFSEKKGMTSRAISSMVCVDSSGVRSPNATSHTK
jgi:hypothetical protein